jgi:hypothetical protein
MTCAKNKVQTKNGRLAVLIFGIAIMSVGLALALLSTGNPNDVPRMERYAGICFIIGCVAFGAALSYIA